MPNKRNNKDHLDLGQSLIEIVVAVGIIAVVLVGVSDLITRSLGLATFQADKTKAVNIAQTQMNYYRNARDLEPTRFFSAGNPTANFSTCVGEIEAKYTCTITYYNPTATGIDMKATVTWKEGGNDISTFLTQTLGKPTQ